MRKVLIIIDYQKEWDIKNSEYYIGNISEKITKLNHLINYCRKEHIPIIFTAHIEKDPKGAFAPDSKGVEIMDKVDFCKESDILLKKNKISPFYKTKLSSTLAKLGAKEIIVTGILTNLCVRSIVSDLYDRDYEIILITDTCATFSNDIHKFTVKDLKETRPEIKFITSKKFILEK